MYRKEAGTWKPGKKTVGDDEVVEDINPWGQKTPTKLYNFYDADDAVQAI